MNRIKDNNQTITNQECQRHKCKNTDNKIEYSMSKINEHRNSGILCPCGMYSRTKHTTFNKGETDYHTCTNCGLVFREKYPTTQELERIYEAAYCFEYIKAKKTEQESGDYAIRSYSRFLASKLIFPGMRVLDFGSGTGCMVEELSREGIFAEGLEYSSSARAHCERTRGIRLLSGHDPIKQNTYDLVTMIEVIEHLTDLTGTLKALHNALKPGGLIFLTTPNRKGLRALVERGSWREARKKFHLSLFDWHSLFYHLQANGFEDVQRLVFNPLQKSGCMFWLAARMMQTVRLSGTLCVIARKSK